MNTLLLSLATVLALTTAAEAQVTCYRLGQYTTCNGPDRQSTTLTELSPGRGIITTDHDAQPYTVFPSAQPDRHRDLNHAIEQLDRLDSYDPYRHDDSLSPFLPLGLGLE
jgi:hypothetical protein